MAVWLSYIVPLRHPKIIHERGPAKVSLELLPLAKSWAWCLSKIPHRKLTLTLGIKAHCRGNLIVSNQHPGAHVSVFLRLIAWSNLFDHIHLLRLKLGQPCCSVVRVIQGPWLKRLTQCAATTGINFYSLRLLGTMERRAHGLSVFMIALI